MARAYIEVPLTGKKANGRVTLIDIDDYETVIRHNWNVAERTKGLHKYGPYAQTTLFPAGRKTSIKLHQFVAGSNQDHVNGCGLDNRQSNLRDATKREQVINRSTWGASPYRGVSWQGHYWQARITLKGKRVRLGLFKDQKSAARAYDTAAKVEYGEFARLNFP